MTIYRPLTEFEIKVEVAERLLYAAQAAMADLNDYVEGYDVEDLTAEQEEQVIAFSHVSNMVNAAWEFWPFGTTGYREDLFDFMTRHWPIGGIV